MGRRRRRALTPERGTVFYVGARRYVLPVEREAAWVEGGPGSDGGFRDLAALLDEGRVLIADVRDDIASPRELTALLGDVHDVTRGLQWLGLIPLDKPTLIEMLDAEEGRPRAEAADLLLPEAPPVPFSMTCNGPPAMSRRVAILGPWSRYREERDARREALGEEAEPDVDPRTGIPYGDLT